MPVREVTPPKGQTGPCYRFGSSGNTYCGKGAKAKAEAQQAAAYANGYKGPKKGLIGSRM